MSPEESVQYIKQFADAAGEVIGEGWEFNDGNLTPPADGHTGWECTLPDGREGVQYALLWLGPGVADPEAAIQQIQQRWKALGVDLAIQSAAEVARDPSDPALVLSDPPYLTGTYEDGYGMELRVSTTRTSFGAQTHCVAPARSATPVERPRRSSSVNAATPEESVQYIKQFADAAGEVIGEGWDWNAGEPNPPADGHTGDECTLPDGREGVQYALLWLGPGVADPTVAIRQIQQRWKALGVDLTVQSAAQVARDPSDPALVLSDPSYLTGAYEDGYGMVLRVSTTMTSLNTRTHCVVPVKKRAAK